MIALGVRRLGRDGASRRCPRPPRPRRASATESAAGRGQEQAAHDAGILWGWPRIARAAAAGVDGAVRGLRQRRAPAGGRRLRPPTAASSSSAVARAARDGSASGAGCRSSSASPAPTGRTTVSTSCTRSDGKRTVRDGLAYPGRGADRRRRSLIGRDVTTRHDTATAIAAALDLERRNFLILLVAGALALAAAMGLADMAGLQPARRRRAGRRPDLVRRLLRRPGRRLPRLRARGAGHRPRGRRAAALVPPVDAHGRRRLRRLRRDARRRRLLGRLLDVPALGPPPPRGGRARARARRARVRRARARRR